MEECLIALGVDANHAIEIIAPFRELRECRNKLKGHASGEAARELQSKALTEHGSYRNHFIAICTRCDASLSEISTAINSPPSE